MRYRVTYIYDGGYPENVTVEDVSRALVENDSIKFLGQDGTANLVVNYKYFVAAKRLEDDPKPQEKYL